MTQALRDALALLADNPRHEADELCDRIVGLLEAACEYEDCGMTATDVAYRREGRTVLRCCHAHAVAVLDETSSEYTHTCENCGCFTPIN